MNTEHVQCWKACLKSWKGKWWVWGLGERPDLLFDNGDWAAFLEVHTCRVGRHDGMGVEPGKGDERLGTGRTT